MNRHGYTAEQALEILMKKLRKGNEELFASVQSAIDAGKDINEREPMRHHRKKPHVYRRTVPFSYEEALQVAIDALQAHFIEQPLFVNSCITDLSEAAIAFPRTPLLSEFDTTKPSINDTHRSEGKETEVIIELQTETQISRKGKELFNLERISLAQIEKQRRNLDHLKMLVDFSEERNGHLK